MKHGEESGEEEEKKIVWRRVPDIAAACP